MRTQWFLLTALIVSLAALPAHAQQTLTLQAAFNLALQNNKNLLAARESIDQAVIQGRKAWTIMGPSVEAQAAQSWNNEIVTQFAATDPREPVLITPTNPDFSCPDPTTLAPGDFTSPTGINAGPACVFSQPTFQDVIVRPGTSRTLTLSGTQPIFIGGLIPALQAAGDQKELARANFSDAREQVLYNVANLYYNTVAAERFVELQRQSYENLQKHLASTRTKYEVGQIPRMGVLQAQIELTRAAAALSRARNDYLNAQAALANLIGITELPRLSSPDAMTTATWVPSEFPTDPTQAALANRSDLRASMQQLELAKTSRNSVWWRFAPSVVATGQIQRNTDPGAFGEQDSWTVMAVASIPLIDKGQRVVDLQDSFSRIRQAELMLEAKQNEVRLDIQTSRSKLEVTRQNLAVAEEQMQLADENYQITTLSFENGLATSLDVIDANQALLGAEINLLRERFNLQLDTLNYLRALGLLEEELTLAQADK